MSLPTVSPYSSLPLPSQKSLGAPILSARPPHPSNLSQDTFEKVAHVLIKPFNGNEYFVFGEVNAQGDIVQPGLTGRQFLGHIDQQGNYRLINGLQGNFFRDPYLQIEPSPLGELLSEQENALANSLKAAERQRAVKGSEIPLIRLNLTSKGMDGRGIKVGILDPLSKGKQGNWQPGSHSQLVAGIINDPLWGVAPKAQVIDAGAPYIDVPVSTSDNLSEYQAYLVNRNCQPVNYTTGQIYKAIQRRDSQLRVLNVTYVNVVASDYSMVLGHLQTKNENGYYKYPRLRAAILGNTLYGTPKQQLIACQQFVDKTMAESPLLKQAYLQYVEATRQAAQAGLITVVGSGNSHNELPYDLPLLPGACFSIESRSPYVISVAASNTNQTPSNRLDDMPARFSSRGDGYLWNPTIAAPGAEMGVSAPVGELGHNLVVEGTSYATPYTCGVIAMMLQQNPFQTFEQVKTKLQMTAVKNPRYSIAEVGAGFLNPKAAVYA